MTELSAVHKYAAGALFALALNQAQIQSCSRSPRQIAEREEAAAAAAEEPIFWQNDSAEASWTSEVHGLAQHVFRHLGIEPKSWRGLEGTATSSDAKHHIGAFLRLLSEDEEGKASCSSSECLSESDLTKAIDAMSIKVQESSTVAKHMEQASAAECSSAAAVDDSKDNNLTQNDSTSGPDHSELAATTSTAFETFDSAILTRQRKMAILYELLVACVADTAEDKARARAGYDARYRAALRLLAAWFNVAWTQVAAMEVMVAYVAMAAQKGQATSTQTEGAEKSKWAKWKRGTLIGAAALTGGTLLAITGGLAAPAIAAGLAALAPAAGTLIPVIGASGFAAAATATGSAAGSIAVAASFGAAGAGLTGSKMARRTGDVDEFSIQAIGENYIQGRLAVGIVVSGYILEEDDFTKPWKLPDGDLEMYALRWESKILLAVSTAIQDWLTTAVARELMKQGAMLTVLSGLLTALAWPAALLSATDFIDSKWALAVDRSDKAGDLLAKCLVQGLQGCRPVTLIGFSLGARVIFSCLQHLADSNAEGVVERVVLMGAPLAIDQKLWIKARKVVSGRFVNCFSTNDWILGIVYRASIMSQGLAGIQTVDVPGVENLDVTSLVTRHSSYLSEAPRILQMVNIDSCWPL